MAFVRFLALLAAFTQIAHAQSDAPALPGPAPFNGPDQVKQAVQRALPFIEDEGLAWRNERKCASCHRNTFMVWTFNEGKARGRLVRYLPAPHAPD